MIVRAMERGCQKRPGRASARCTGTTAARLCSRPVMSTQLPTLDASRFEPPPDAVDFYVESLKLLTLSGLPFLLSGTYALSCYTGITRPTKDLDVFCKPSDAPRILRFFKGRGYRIDIEDERWIGKVWKGEHFFDVIYNMSTASIPVSDHWFREAYEAEIYGTNVR